MLPKDPIPPRTGPTVPLNDEGLIPDTAIEPVTPSPPTPHSTNRANKDRMLLIIRSIMIVISIILAVVLQSFAVGICALITALLLTSLLGASKNYALTAVSVVGIYALCVVATLFIESVRTDPAQFWFWTAVFTFFAAAIFSSDTSSPSSKKS